MFSTTPVLSRAMYLHDPSTGRAHPTPATVNTQYWSRVLEPLERLQLPGRRISSPHSTVKTDVLVYMLSASEETPTTYAAWTTTSGADVYLSYSSTNVSVGGGGGVGNCRPRTKEHRLDTTHTLHPVRRQKVSYILQRAQRTPEPSSICM